MYTWQWAWDNFSFTIALALGAFMVGCNTPRRSVFWLRVFISCTILTGFVFAWELITTYLYSLDAVRRHSYIWLAKYFIQYIIVVLLMWRCFDFNIFAALFCATASYCIEHISQRSYMILARYALSGVHVAVGILIRFAITVSLYILVYFIAIRKNKASLSSIAVNNKVQVLLSAVIIFAVVFLTHFVGRSETNAALSRTAVNLLTISSAFLALVLEFNMTFLKKHQNEVDELQHMLYEKGEQYKIEKANIEQINIKLHDLRHQIAALDDIIDKKELTEIASIIDIYNNFIETGNKAIDTVITQKSFYCQKHNIRLSCLLDGRALGYIPANELYALFGNAIENAIAAVEKLNIEKRVISIVETRNGGFITIRLTNYYEGKIEFSEGLPVTQKNQEYHGFGMKSIKLLAEKYGGRVEAQTRSDLFMLAICLPISKKNDQADF